MVNWEAAYTQALPYAEFLGRYGTDAHRQRWQGAYERTVVTPGQRDLLETFTREMRLLCLAGTWCGDCVREGAILQRIVEAAPRVELRFLDRDEHPEIARELAINDGLRIPVVVFLSEDFFECGRYGERTLATYRKIAQDRLGAQPGETGPMTPEEHYAAVVQDWMNELERIQLLLRLSPRLRAKHGD
jgi:thiol-disulfide isomerase/thioredoxin